MKERKSNVFQIIQFENKSELHALIIKINTRVVRFSEQKFYMRYGWFHKINVWFLFQHVITLESETPLHVLETIFISRSRQPISAWCDCLYYTDFRITVKWTPSFHVHPSVTSKAEKNHIKYSLYTLHLLQSNCLPALYDNQDQCFRQPSPSLFWNVFRTRRSDTMRAYEGVVRFWIVFWREAWNNKSLSSHTETVWGSEEWRRIAGGLEYWTTRGGICYRKIIN